MSYASIVEAATRAFTAKSYRLVEAAAGAVADEVLVAFPRIASVRVTVHKPHAPIAAIFNDVGVTILRTRQAVAEALIALGGNVGDARATLDRAVAMFCDGDAVTLHARSSDYRTPPWGVEDQPPFINLCLAVATALSPRDLLARAQRVERAFGRDRASEQRWGPRPVDIDLLAYDDVTLARTGPDAAAPAPVRARLRAGAARRDRAGPPDRRNPGARRAGPARYGRHRAAAAPGGRSQANCALVRARVPWHFPSMSDDLTLGAEFPAATREQWLKLVDGVLKGAPFDKKLVSRTYDGLRIEPLYRRAAGARPVAGRAPGAAWALMQRVDHPDPAAANAQALQDLENGANGLTLVFAGSVSANGYGLDAARRRSRACSTASGSTPASPSTSTSARRPAMRSGISPRW